MKKPLRKPARKLQTFADPLADCAAEIKDLRQLCGQNVRAWRERRGLTLKQLSQRSGVTPRTIDRIEHGESKSRMTTLCWIAEALEVKWCHLWKGDKPIFKRIWKKRRLAAASAKSTRRRRSGG